MERGQACPPSPPPPLYRCTYTLPPPPLLPSCVQEAGAAFITLHPRTRRERYTGAANWALIADAVALLDIPVVGSGDVTTAEGALAMARETGAAGIMVRPLDIPPPSNLLSRVDGKQRGWW